MATMARYNPLRDVSSLQDEVERVSYRDGMLTIVVPKAEESKPRRIAIQAS